MLQDILLPRLGQTMEEGTIERWHKAEGERVERGEILYELTTDKATLEVESFATGVLKKILVAEGETAPVNELIAVVGEEDDELPADWEAYRAQASAAASEQEPAAPDAAAAIAATPQPHEAEVEQYPAVEPSQPPAPARLFASPRAKKIAAEQQVPLAILQGTGPNGRIVERDVEKYLDELARIKYTPTARKVAYGAGVSLLDIQPDAPDRRITKADVLRAAQAALPAATARPGERIAMTPMRQTIAKRMAQSKQTVPHFYLVGDVMMRRALERRHELNAAGDVHITITDLLVRAVALALTRHPRVNARFAGGAIIVNAAVNVGVAVAVEDGLFVPVIRGADKKTLAQVSAELKPLAARAREGKLTPDQYEGGSITISNLGTFGVDYFLPIVNPPETCILGVGRVAEQIVVQDGAMRIEPVMKVSLSADHRVVDGAEAAKFYRTLRELLEEPESL